jgi:hypothetical protein
VIESEIDHFGSPPRAARGRSLLARPQPAVQPSDQEVRKRRHIGALVRGMRDVVYVTLDALRGRYDR